LCSVTTLSKYGRGRAVVAIPVSPVVDNQQNNPLVQGEGRLPNLAVEKSRGFM